jgi:hypothetical protein
MRIRVKLAFPPESHKRQRQFAFRVRGMAVDLAHGTKDILAYVHASWILEPILFCRYGGYWTQPFQFLS